MHFGSRMFHDPICQINKEKYRKMEVRMHAYNDEDAEIHRQLYALRSEHATARRREEEKGYARGLADAALLHPSPQVEEDKKLIVLSPELLREVRDALITACGFIPTAAFDSYKKVESVIRTIDKLITPTKAHSAPIERE